MTVEAQSSSVALDLTSVNVQSHRVVSSVACTCPCSQRPLEPSSGYVSSCPEKVGQGLVAGTLTRSKRNGGHCQRIVSQPWSSTTSSFCGGTRSWCLSRDGVGDVTIIG